MKTITYTGTETGAFSLDVGELGIFSFHPALGIVSVEAADEAALIVAASQPHDYEVSP